MIKSNDICIIGVYYGRFNNYFPLWLKSCQANPTIDFMIVTDIQYNQEIPSNVRFLDLSINEVQHLAITKIGVDIPSLPPKKLCDLKPMYGLIFEDYLQQYDYWGECDFDLIWGDIRYFANKYEYRKYDKFLPLGHLSLYRNTPETNRYFMLEGDQMGGYVSVLQTSENMIFDEVMGINRIYQFNNKTSFFHWIFADITRLHKRYMLSAGLTPEGVLQCNYKSQIFYWSDGKVYRDYYQEGIRYTEEFMYIHFSGRSNFELKDDILSSKAFYITYDGFIPKVGECTKEEIKKFNNNCYIKEKYDHLRYFLFRVCNKLGFRQAWKIE